MSFIALFLPACISMVIRHKRSKKEGWHMPEALLEYGILVLINVFLSTVIIVYGLRISEVNMEAFLSFPFFTKYLFISIFLACILPYVEEFIRKYINISFEVKRSDEE